MAHTIKGLSIPVRINVTYVISLWQAVKLRIAGFHLLPRHKVTIEELIRR